MARKVKRKPAAQKAQENTSKALTKKESFFKKNKKAVIIVSVVLAAALIAGIVFGITSLVNGGAGVDYLNDDLSKYVYISSEDYKNYPVSVPLLSVDESDVLREINKLLVEHKDENALFGGASVRPDNYTIKLGDVVNIWYRGYSVDENGIKTELEGTSNFQSSKPDALEIGSGSFVKGFEEALIGKPLHQKSLEFVTSGKIQEGDVIYISYSAFLSNGAPATFSNVIIDTSDRESVNKTYGAGFAEFFIGKTVGDYKGITQAFRIEGDEVDTVYYELKIESAVRSEEEPYSIDIVFPADYRNESFRGLKATFEVYASTAVVYNKIPEWNDAFISETLKETHESLSDYQGENLTKRYENKIRRELEAMKEATNKALIEEEMWRHYHSKLEVKKLPKAEVKKIYLQYLGEIRQYYSFYGSSFKSFDEFARYYFGLSEKANWSDYIMEEAKTAVTEKLVFYYIINKEGIAPNSSEYERIYNEIKEEHMKEYTELYKTELEASKTEEEKEAKLLEIETRMLEYYGETYFKETVYYRYANDYLIEFANVK